MILNKIVNNIRKVSKTLLQNTLETVPIETENVELNAKITNETYISPEKRQKNIGKLSQYK